MLSLNFPREKKLNMKPIILIAIFTLLCIVSSSNGRYQHRSNDDGVKSPDENARMFLRAMMNGDSDDSDDDNSASMDTRQTGCVACKFGLAPCCPPNFCQKKFMWPDKCISVKPGK